MRRLAHVAGGRLLASAAAAAAPLSGRAALAAGSICGEHATRGASAATSRAFAASSRALSASGAPTDKAEDGEEGTEPQQPATAAEEAEERQAREFRSFRSRERPTVTVVQPPRENKPPLVVTKFLAMNVKLSALIAERNHDAARELFERWRDGKVMKEDGTTPEPFTPDVYSYTYYISTLVRHRGKPVGNLKSLDAALAEMKALGINPGPPAFTPFAWLAFNLADWDMGKRLYATIVRHGLNPSDIAVCYLISLAVMKNDARGAGEVLNAAVAANRLRSFKDSERIIHTMNDLFFLAVKVRTYDIAAKALSVARAHKSTPPFNSLTEMAAGTADLNDLENALAAVDALASKDPEHYKTMDEGTVLALLNAAARNGHKALASAALQQLEATVKGRGGVPPSAATQVAVVSCAALVGDVAAAFRAANGLRHLGVAPPMVMEPVVELMAQGGATALDDAYFAAERMHKNGELQGNGTVNVLTAIVAACARARDVERAFQTHEVVEPVFGAPLTTGAFNALISACIATRSETAVAPLVDEMRVKGVQHDNNTRLLILQAAIGLRDNAGMFAVLTAMVASGSQHELSDAMRRRIKTLALRGDEEFQHKIDALLLKFRRLEAFVPRVEAYVPPPRSRPARAARPQPRADEPPSEDV